MNDLTNLSILAKSDKINSFSYSKEESVFFFNNLELREDNEDGLSFVCAGNLKYPRAYILDRENFDYFALEIILEGVFQLQTSKGVFELSNGSAFAYTPQTSFILKTLKNKASRKYFVVFEGKNAEKLIQDSGLVVGKPIKILQLNRIQNIFEEILNCRFYDPKIANDISRYILLALLKIIKDDTSSKQKILTISYSTFLRCKNYILSNYMTISDIGNVAKECFVNKSYLSRLFKRYEKISPSRFLMNLKMKTAENLLVSQNLNIKTVCDRVGFEDYYHFSKVFKTHFGLPPKAHAEKIKITPHKRK